MNEYNVIKIVDDETIVINAGSNNGIKKGFKFEIYSDGEEVLDPTSGNSLGTLDTIKETVEVINVYSKMSLCRNMTDATLLQPTIRMIENLAIRKPKTLKIDYKEVSGGLSEDLTIKIGDKARLITEVIDDNNE